MKAFQQKKTSQNFLKNNHFLKMCERNKVVQKKSFRCRRTFFFFHPFFSFSNPIPELHSVFGFVLLGIIVPLNFFLLSLEVIPCVGGVRLSIVSVGQNKKTLISENGQFSGHFVFDINNFFGEKKNFFTSHKQELYFFEKKHFSFF